MINSNKININPALDVTFKNLFGIEKNKYILIDFLNKILKLTGEKEIKNITHLDKDEMGTNMIKPIQESFYYSLDLIYNSSPYSYHSIPKLLKYKEHRKKHNNELRRDDPWILFLNNPNDDLLSKKSHQKDKKSSMNGKRKMHLNDNIEIGINVGTRNAQLKSLIDFLKKEELEKVENFIKDPYYKIKDLSEELKINESNILEILSQGLGPKAFWIPLWFYDTLG
ncbi:hypothetical protein U3516DRAFT_852760 [Neocallimastix sp. 'constans']